MYRLTAVPKPWDRLRGREKADTGNDEDKVDLAADEHAWWAGRENLQRTFTPKKRRRPVTEGPTKRRSEYAEFFDTESLFSYGERLPPDPTMDPYAVLGLDETATWDEISAAHRRLAKVHHPDRLLDAAAEDRARSEERMVDLNVAYSELRRRLGH